MNGSETSSQSSLACAIAGRLCLIVSLWQAPIPWLHCHGTDLSKSTSLISAKELNTHLAAFHSAADVSRELDFGWHCHWVLPSWGHVLDGISNADLSPNPSITFDQVTIARALPVCERDSIAIGYSSATLTFRQIIHGHLSKLHANRVDWVSQQEQFSVLRC